MINKIVFETKEYKEVRKLINNIKMSEENNFFLKNNLWLTFDTETKNHIPKSEYYGRVLTILEVIKNEYPKEENKINDLILKTDKLYQKIIIFPNNKN